MERALQKALIEAILFLREEPVKTGRLASVLDVSAEEAEILARELKDDLDKAKRGIRIYEVAGGYRMGTPPEFAGRLAKIFGEEAAGNLSAAAMETLSIIAYRQPVTRVEIESVRGVKCEHVLENLQRRKLIRITGRRESPGRPLLYGTTNDFLKYFGLSGLDELPPLDGDKTEPLPEEPPGIISTE